MLFPFASRDATRDWALPSQLQQLSATHATAATLLNASIPGFQTFAQRPLINLHLSHRATSFMSRKNTSLATRTSHLLLTISSPHGPAN
jgi:hypothetical protein